MTEEPIAEMYEGAEVRKSEGKVNGTKVERCGGGTTHIIFIAARHPRSISGSRAGVLYDPVSLTLAKRDEKPLAYNHFQATLVFATPSVLSQWVGARDDNR
jgi:hypothetical protein